MPKRDKTSVCGLLLGFFGWLLLVNPGAALAEEPTSEEMLARIESLEQEVVFLKGQLQENTQTAQEAKEKSTVALEKSQAASQAATASDLKPYLPSVPDVIWHLAGYATAGLEFQTKADKNTFVSGKFNPVLHFQYKNILLFEGELEIEVNEDGETEVVLEYSQFNFLVHDNVVIVIGKYLSPVGQFQERLHPNWINKLADAPAGFGHDGAQPGSDVGIQIRGGIPFGKKGLFTYVLAAGNGPRMGAEGNVEFEGFGRDDNNNKAFGGRIGILPVPFFEVGVSFWKAGVDGLEGPGVLEPTRADAQVIGFDAAYTRGPWDVRFEYLKNTRDPINSFEEEDDEIVMMPKLTLETWYAQIAYRLSEISDSPFIQRLEPVFRYGKFTAMGNHHLEEMAERRVNVGLNYWIAPSAVARLGLEWRNFIDPEMMDETVIQLQVSYGF